MQSATADSSVNSSGVDEMSTKFIWEVNWGTGTEPVSRSGHLSSTPQENGHPHVVPPWRRTEFELLDLIGGGGLLFLRHTKKYGKKCWEAGRGRRQNSLRTFHII